MTPERKQEIKLEIVKDVFQRIEPGDIIAILQELISEIDQEVAEITKLEMARGKTIDTCEDMLELVMKRAMIIQTIEDLNPKESIKTHVRRHSRTKKKVLPIGFKMEEEEPTA